MSEILPDDLFAIDSSQVNLPPYDKFPILSFENLLLRRMTQEDIPHCLPIVFYKMI